MTLISALAAMAAGVVLSASVAAASTVVPIDNEPAPRLIVEQPLPEPLARGVVYIPYRVENLRIVPVGGAVAREISPRIGHLHVSVDDLRWQWADFGQSNTIILIGMPPGEHTVLIDVVDPMGKVHTGQKIRFTTPGPNQPR
jgi:hypothetical protein